MYLKPKIKPWGGIHKVLLWKFWPWIKKGGRCQVHSRGGMCNFSWEGGADFGLEEGMPPSLSTCVLSALGAFFLCLHTSMYVYTYNINGVPKFLLKNQVYSSYRASYNSTYITCRDFFIWLLSGRKISLPQTTTWDSWPCTGAFISYNCRLFEWQLILILLAVESKRLFLGDIFLRGRSIMFQLLVVAAEKRGSSF